MWPKYPAGYGSSAEAQAAAEAEANRAMVVPIAANGKPAIRVDFTEASLWRVISLSGEPLVSSLATQAEAEAHMAKYLKELKLRMPTEEELAEAAAKREAKEAARQRDKEDRMARGGRPALRPKRKAADDAEAA